MSESGLLHQVRRDKVTEQCWDKLSAGELSPLPIIWAFSSLGPSAWEQPSPSKIVP